MIRSMELMARLKALKIIASPSQEPEKMVISVVRQPSPGSTWKDYGYETAEEMFFAERAKNESRYGGQSMMRDEEED